MVTAAQAQAALQLRANNMEITKEGIMDLLVAVKGVTFAQIVHCTDVVLAAASRNAGEEFVKVTSCNVQLFNNIKDYRNVYEAAVKRSAEKLGQSAQSAIDAFESKGAWYTHDDDCFCVVSHPETNAKYLFFIANGGESTYYDVKHSRTVTKQELYPHLTPSGVRALTKPEVQGHSGVTHDVVVRAVKLENLLGIKAMGHELAVVPVKKRSTK